MSALRPPPSVLPPSPRLRRGKPVLRPPIAALLACVALGGTSCAKRETPVEEGVRTQTLLIGKGAEPVDLDPHVVWAFLDQIVQFALFEGLTAFDERTAQAVPAAAERWEVSADGLTWTFHLRDGLTWSNGDPLVADDFVQSFRRVLTPAIACPLAYMYSPVKNANAFNAGKITDPAALGFAAPDPRTVVVTLAQPTAILPMLAALPCWQPINPRVLARFNALSQRGAAWTRPGNLVGNGPFTLAEWKPNDRLVVVKNPRYWGAAQCRLERIVFFPIESSDVEEKNFRAGQLHVTNTLPLTKVATYRNESPDRLRIDPFLEVIYIQFNCGKPPLDNPKLRRALALAIDRDAIARAVYRDVARPATSYTPPGCCTYVPRPQLATDVEAARRLLAEAGYAGSRGLPVIPLSVGNDTLWPRLAEVLQGMWKRELGVNVTIELVDLKTGIQNSQTKAYSIGLAGWSADYADPASFLNVFLSDGSSNWTAWSSPAYDRLLLQAARTVDAAARFEIFQEAEALLLTEMPVVPVVFTQKAYLIHPAVKGWEPALLGYHRYQHIRLER